MAREQLLEQRKKQMAPTAVDLAFANHQSEGKDVPLEFEADAALMEEEYDRLRAFLEQRKNQKTSQSVFMKINESEIFGAKGQYLKAGVIPLFSGAALDLSQAQLMGEKRFLKPPQAKGKGGTLVLLPQKFNQGLTLPVANLMLKDNFVEGDVNLQGRSGFHGKHLRLTAEKIHITMDQAEFLNPKMVYQSKEGESVVPVPEKVAVTKDGFTPTLLANTLRLSAPEQPAQTAEEIAEQEQPAQEMVQETVQETEETTPQEQMAQETEETTPQEQIAQTTEETTQPEQLPQTVEEMVEQEEAANEPDHIIFQAGPGRFHTRANVRPQMKMTKYDGFTVQRKDGQLMATIKIGSKEYTTELSETETYHTFLAESLTVEAKDSLGLINGLLGEMGISDVEMDDSELCYHGLEITENGIFYTSMKNSTLSAEIGEDWDVKLGRNNAGIAFNGDLLSEEEEDDGSYFDLAKNILQFLGIIKEDEKEGESEEEDEDDQNSFHFCVPFFTFPLIPGLLSVDAKFAAGANVGYKVGGSVNNLAGMLKKQQTESFGLDLYAALNGSAYAGFQVGITAGLTFLMNVSGNIGAKIALTGDEDDNNILAASVKLEMMKNRYGRPFLEKAVFDAKGELRLRAIIEASLNAEILGWEKTLYSYKFKDWELAAIQAEIMATREQQNGRGKWSADASLSYRALSNKLKGTLDNQDELQKMMQKQEESYGQKAFDASQSSFEDAKQMLYAYQDKSKPMFVSTDAQNSGFLDMNQVIGNLQRRFYNQLRINQDTIAIEMDEMERLNRDKDYQKLGAQLQGKINQHTANLQTIEKALEESKQGGSAAASQGATTPTAITQIAQAMQPPSERIMQAYVAGGGNKSGFLSHMRERSKQEAVTVASLITYEENRRKELTKKSEARIAQLRAFATSLGIADMDKTKGSVLLQKYQSLGGKAVNKALFTDIRSLIGYEQQRILERHSYYGNRYQIHQDRLDDLAKKFPDIVQNGSDVPNGEFYHYYTMILGAKNFHENLDLYSNRQRLLDYEKNALSKKIAGSEKGTKALARREIMYDLLNLGVRDQQQQTQWDEILSDYAAMTTNENAAYRTATKEDLIAALAQREKAMALKETIAQKQREGKENKKKTWLYEAMRMDLTIEDLIAYEQKRAASYAKGKKKQNHEKRIQFLIQQQTEAQNLRQTNPEKAERILYDAIQTYFGLKKMENQTKENAVDFHGGKGFQEDVLQRVQMGDASVQKLFQSIKWMPEESNDLKSLRQDEGFIYELMRRHGIREGGDVNHEQNRLLLKQYRSQQGPREYTMDDLYQYYTYQIHHSSAATFRSGKKLDHLTVMETLEGITDYPEMLKKYKEMGRGRKFLEHEQMDAGNWVTPNMILNYERERMHGMDQKHWDRIEALKKAEGGSQEEQAEALKEYAEMAKRFHKKGGEETLKLSLQDIINAELAHQAMKVAVHDQRLEQLRSTEAEMTDEVKIGAYGGTRFSPDKEEVERIYNQHFVEIMSNPESMAKELTAFETGEKGKQEELFEQWQQVKLNLSDQLILLAEQAEQCEQVIKNTEQAIKDPKSIFESEASTKAYVQNVLEKTENDLQQVPEIIKAAEESEK